MSSTGSLENNDEFLSLPPEQGDAESGVENSYLSLALVYGKDEKRRQELHQRRLRLATCSYVLGVILLIVGAFLACFFSMQLWGERSAFLSPETPAQNLAELRIFLIAHMSFKASFVAGLFTTGGLLLRGAQRATEPQPYPPGWLDRDASP